MNWLNYKKIKMRTKFSHPRTPRFGGSFKMTSTAFNLFCEFNDNRKAKIRKGIAQRKTRRTLTLA